MGTISKKGKVFKTRNAKSKLKKNKSIAFKLLMFFIVGCVLMFFLVLNEVFAFFRFSQTRCLVEIPKSSSVAKIGKILKTKKIVNSSFLFSKYVKIRNANLKHGVFNLNSAMSYGEIVEILTDEMKNEQKFVQLNFYEGSNFFILQKKYNNKTDFDFDLILKKINSEAVYSKFSFFRLLPKSQLKNAFWPMEGFLSTDSFNIKSSYDELTVANLVLAKIDSNINSFLNKFNEEFKNSRLNLWELITLASIIQGETYKISDMPIISSVLHNRLNSKNMKRLECDVTIIYANNIKQEMQRRHCKIDQKKLDSYNTYKCFGLPAGPVCNPGFDALKAALKPAKTDYFYFCTNTKTGEVFFARNFKEHCVNLKKANLI